MIRAAGIYVKEGLNPRRDVGSQNKALELEYTDSGKGVSRRDGY
jgi:hypothetical protein